MNSSFRRPVNWLCGAWKLSSLKWDRWTCWITQRLSQDKWSFRVVFEHTVCQTVNAMHALCIYPLGINKVSLRVTVLLAN